MNTVLWKENFIAIAVAGLLAFGIFTVLENMSFFQANIVASPQELLDSADIILEADQETFTLRAHRDFDQVDMLSVLIFTNPETVVVPEDRVRSSFPVSLRAQEWGVYFMLLEGIESFDRGDEIVSLVIEWSYNDITIWDIVVTFADESYELLALWTTILSSESDGVH